jgi:hypothetical protein
VGFRKGKAMKSKPYPASHQYSKRNFVLSFLKRDKTTGKYQWAAH